MWARIAYPICAALPSAMPRKAPKRGRWVPGCGASSSHDREPDTGAGCEGARGDDVATDVPDERSVTRPTQDHGLADIAGCVSRPGREPSSMRRSSNRVRSVARRVARNIPRLSLRTSDNLSPMFRIPCYTLRQSITSASSGGRPGSARFMPSCAPPSSSQAGTCDAASSARRRFAAFTEKMISGLVIANARSSCRADDEGS